MYGRGIQGERTGRGKNKRNAEKQERGRERIIKKRESNQLEADRKSVDSLEEEKGGEDPEP